MSISIVYLLRRGGLGDHIARLPALKYIERRWPYVKALVIVPDYFLDLAKELLSPNERREYYSIDSLKQPENQFLFQLPSYEFTTRISPSRTHLTDLAFTTLCDGQPEYPEAYNYCAYNQKGHVENVVRAWNLRAPYAVVTTGFTAEVREWPSEQINEVAQWLAARQILPVFLGARGAPAGNGTKIEGRFNNDVDYSLGVDLRDQTTLVEAAEIISHATVVVGLDNGLLHLAGCTDVPIVGAFTSIDPKFRIPYRPKGVYKAIVPENCEHCQTFYNFIIEYDFRKCYPQKACNKALKAVQFTNAIEEVLNETL